MTAIPSVRTALVTWSSRNAYLFTVVLVAIVARFYWELMRDDYHLWWSIDGYPTLVAAHLLVEGKAAFIYHPELWLDGMGNREWHRMLGLLNIVPSGTSFVYHPTYLYFVSPLLGRMTHETFIVFWLGVNALSVGVVAAELMAQRGVLPGRQRTALSVLIAVSFPVLYGAFLGQNVVPALALFLVANRLAWSGRIVLAAPGFVLAAAMKMWLLPVVLLSALLSGGRALLIVLAALALGLLVIPVWTNAGLMESYLVVLRNFSEVVVFSFNNVSVPAIFGRLTDPHWIAQSHRWTPLKLSSEAITLGWMFVGAVALVALGLIIRYRPDRSSLLVSGVSLVLLIPGIVWTHYLAVLLPLALWLASDDRAWVRVAGWAGFGLLCVPWHSLIRATNQWPTPGDIAASPILAQCLLATPLLLATVGALLVLTGGRAIPIRVNSSGNTRAGLCCRLRQGDG